MGISKISCKALVDGKPCEAIMAEVDNISGPGINQGYLSCPNRHAHDANRPRILEPRDADREIERMAPRPGIARHVIAANPDGSRWSVMPAGFSGQVQPPRSQSHTWVDHNASNLDLRTLTQDETDFVIIERLRAESHFEDRPVVIGMTTNPKPVIRAVRLSPRIEFEPNLWPSDGIDYWQVTDQRGGIHSDPMVRLLAFYLWGRRDIDFVFPKAEPKKAPTPAAYSNPPAAPRPSPRGFRHQAGCVDPRCDGQCVSSKETWTTPREILSRAMGSLSDRSPITNPTGPFDPKKKR